MNQKASLGEAFLAESSYSFAGRPGWTSLSHAPLRAWAKVTSSLLISFAAYFQMVSYVVAQSYKVAHISVCRNVAKSINDCQEATPPFDNLNRRQFPSESIYFLATIICGADAVKFLRLNSYLPVYIAIWRDGEHYNLPFQVGITEDEWDDQSGSLLAAYNSTYSFTWTTRFYVNTAGASDVKLELLDAKGNLTYQENKPARLDLHFN